MASHPAEYKLDDFDVVLVTCADIHGVARGRFVFRSSLRGVFKSGLGMTQAALFCGVCCDIPINLTEFRDEGWTSGSIVPDVSSLRPIAWLSTKETKVGHALCSMYDVKGQKETALSREMVLKQLDALQHAGFTIRMSATVQFSIFYKGTLTPVPVHANLQGSLAYMINVMRESGIPVFSLELGPETGKLQIKLDEVGGLEIADAIHRLRNAVRCLCAKEELEVTFMTKPSAGVSSNRISYEMRLIDTGNQSNAFRGVDGKTGGYTMSDVGKSWLSGLLLHHQCLTILTRPSFNCYTQGETIQANTWTSHHSDDGTQRLVVFCTGDPSIAERLPSSASNPYIVVAALVAAGLDGLENKFQLNEMNEATPESFPKTFESALNTLERENSLLKRLGKPFVRRFYLVKKDYELARLVNNETESGAKLDSLAFARDVYFKTL